MSDIELDPRWIEYKMEQYKEKESQIMNDKLAVESQNKNELKCPFCQQKLDTGSYYVHCHNQHCNTTVEMEGTEELWQELIRTRKALDVALKCLNGVVKDLPWVKRTLEQITALEQKDK